LPGEPLATHGAAVRARYRVSGIIGEARTGMPTVFATMLPMYCSVRRRGWSRDLAGALTLLAGVARCEDTTILHRHGPETHAEVVAEAAGLTKDWQIARPEELYARLRALDERWSAARISPGGSADLLCMTLYVLRLRSAAGRSGPRESQ